MRNVVTLFTLLLGSIFILSTAHAAKPEWWPPGKPGVEWPPKKPENWTGAWPPENKDLNWWIKHFAKQSQGKPGKAGSPKDPTTDGHAGHRDFSNGFIPIEQRAEKKLDCGWFRVSQSKTTIVKSCKPFPAKIVKASCLAGLKPKDAEDVCKAQCARGKICKKHKLFEPAMFSSWGCYESAVEPDSMIAVCRVDFLCECKK